jgi:hypothetical protein
MDQETVVVVWHARLAAGRDGRLMPRKVEKRFDSPLEAAKYVMEKLRSEQNTARMLMGGAILKPKNKRGARKPRALQAAPARCLDAAKRYEMVVEIRWPPVLFAAAPSD